MKFIHFGCWNECGIDSEKKTPLSKVMERMNLIVRDENIKFIVIAGDNYYYPKNSICNTYLNKKENNSDSEDERKINVETFLSGFKALPSNIPKYLLFGNHEIDLSNIIDSQNENRLKCEFKNDHEKLKNIFNDSNQNENLCQTLDLQLLYTSKYPCEFKVFDEPELINKTDNTIIITIDTTLLSYYGANSIQNFGCYSRIFKKSKVNTINELIEYQITKVITIINTNQHGLKNIIIIGHHPIYGVKIKDNKIVMDSNNGLIYLYHKINALNCHSCVKHYYLCADIHLYQHGIITIINNENHIKEIVINQYICATGGAHLDYLHSPLGYNVEMLFKNKFNNNTYYMRENINNIFGFLTVDITKDDLKFDFIRAFEDEIKCNKDKKSVDNNMKYLKYKTKYFNIKNNNM